MIRAVELDTDFLSRTTSFMFVMDSPGGELIHCRDGAIGGGAEGWWTWADIYPNHQPGERIEPGAPSAHNPYIVRLDPDMLHALTETLIVRATNTPMAAIAGIRKDLEHERSRRDLLEDTVIRIAEKHA